MRECSGAAGNRSAGGNGRHGRENAFDSRFLVSAWRNALLHEMENMQMCATKRSSRNPYDAGRSVWVYAGMHAVYPDI